ncbi:MAG: metal ABC transporter permease [Desulfomicrobiaceae bacterium]|nr:metal ABC transporter permease [Desulfomicrobiaceae bacterium]
MTALLHLQFFQYALAAALLASIACGMVGTLITVNRRTFLAGAVSHAAYGGVGLAIFLGMPVLPVTLVFTVAAALLMAVIVRRLPARADSLIGVLWAAGMSAGILLVDCSDGYNADLMSYLFGSILAVSTRDLIVMAAADLGMAAIIFFWYKDFLVMSFDAEFARALGVPVERMHDLLQALIAVAVVLLIQLVGLVLVMALFTIPPMVAETHARSLAQTMALATLVSLVVTLGGLALAVAANLTSGAAIVAVAVTVFALNAVLLHIRKG